MSGIAKDMDTTTYRLPIGVTAGITPFNFPAMIPLWVSVKKTVIIQENFNSFLLSHDIL